MYSKENLAGQFVWGLLLLCEQTMEDRVQSPLSIEFPGLPPAEASIHIYMRELRSKYSFFFLKKRAPTQVHKISRVRLPITIGG